MFHNTLTWACANTGATVFLCTCMAHRKGEHMFTSMTDGRLSKWTLVAFYVEYPKAALMYTQTAQLDYHVLPGLVPEPDRKAL